MESQRDGLPRGERMRVDWLIEDIQYAISKQLFLSGKNVLGILGRGKDI